MRVCVCAHACVRACVRTHVGKCVLERARETGKEGERKRSWATETLGDEEGKKRGRTLSIGCARRAN